MDLSKYLNFVKERARVAIGLDDESLGNTMFERCIVQQAKRRELSVEDFIAQRGSDESEIAEILKLLLISESWFGRDTAPLFEALQLLRERSFLRILSAPCAQGEEVITALACALETGRPLESISLHGIDISEIAIKKAKTFTYGAYSFRAASDEFRRAYFDTSLGCSQLKEKYRKVINYSCENLLSTAAAFYAPFDVILCRNVFIYLTKEARQIILAELSKILNYDGILITTAAEYPFLSESRFESASHNHCIFRLKHATQYLPAIPCGEIAVDQNPAPVVIPSSRPEKITTMYRAKAESAPPLPLPYEEALEQLEYSPNNSTLLFTLGLRTIEAGNLEEAMFWFKKTLEVDPLHIEAQLFISTLSVQGDQL